MSASHRLRSVNSIAPTTKAERSVREIGFLPFAAFKDGFIPMEGLRGAKLSLDDIEHRILRKEIG